MLCTISLLSVGLAHRPAAQRASRRALRCRVTATATQGEDTSDDTETPAPVPIRAFLGPSGVLNENAAKKAERNWEAEEIAAAMNPLEGGVAPELIHGRLAMTGWLGVIFAEKASGLTAWEQYSANSGLINTVAVLLWVATLMPTLVTSNPLSEVVMSSKGGMPKAGPWESINGNVEESVGRAAMVGFTCLLIAEAVKGGPLF
jgi:hypothetical protein